MSGDQTDSSAPNKRSRFPSAEEILEQPEAAKISDPAADHTIAARPHARESGSGFKDHESRDESADSLEPGEDDEPLADVPTEQELSLLEPGTMVGEYRVLHVLGQGGMGAVYAGVQPVIEKPVAIKVLLPKMVAKPGAVQRFVREARLVNQIRSRHIVDIFSFGTLDDGRMYFVMEKIEGQSLAQLLRRYKPLPLIRALPILRCVLRGLAAAHAKGIVHRDLKSENVMVTIDSDGNIAAKLLDFGIAKLHDERRADAAQTLAGFAVGTPNYMSPEQCRGQRVDPRTDIYALGVIMFEMFTGQLPFHGESVLDVMTKHLKESPPNPSSLVPGIIQELDALILYCLAKDPKDRPQSAEYVLDRLEILVEKTTDSTLEVSSDPLGLARGGDEDIGSLETLLHQSSLPGSAANTSPSGRIFTSTAKLARRPAMWMVAVIIVAGAAAAAFVIPHLGGSSERSRARRKGAASRATGGEIFIESQPSGAVVHINDDLITQQTPVRISRAPGTYRLSLTLDGFKPLVRRITLDPKQELVLSYALRKEPKPPGSVLVHTGNPQTRYYLDDAFVGEGADLSLDAVTVGAHSLRLVAKNHESQAHRIQVQANQRLTLNLNLEPTPVEPSIKPRRPYRDTRKKTPPDPNPEPRPAPNLEKDETLAPSF